MAAPVPSSTRMTCGVERWEWEQQYADMAARGFTVWPSVLSAHPHNEAGEDIGTSVLKAMRRRSDAARREREEPFDYGRAADGPIGLPAAPTDTHVQEEIDVEAFVDRMYDQIVRLDLASDRATVPFRPNSVPETAVRRNIEACLKHLQKHDEDHPGDAYGVAEEGDRDFIRLLYATWYDAVDTDSNPPTNEDCDAWRNYAVAIAEPGSDFPLRTARVYKQYVGYTGRADDVYLLNYELECKLELIGDRECADYATNGGLKTRPGHACVRFVPRQHETPVVEYGPNGIVRLISFEIKACVLGGPVPDRLRRRQGKRRRVDTSGLTSMAHAPDISYQVMSGRIFVDILSSTISGRLLARSRCDGAIEYTFKGEREQAMKRTCITNQVQREAQVAPAIAPLGGGLA